MPDGMHILDTGLPRFTGTESTEDRVEAIQNYLFMLLEELRYLLHNLGRDNFNEAELSELLAASAAKAGEEALCESPGDTITAGSVYAAELYAAYGQVADLVVWQLRTDYMRSRNYLRGSLEDLNYISIRDEKLDFITASVAAPLRTTQLAHDGLRFYWTDETRTQMTCLYETPWPVTVYVYDELVKAKLCFASMSGTYVPILTLGAGDGEGGSQARIWKALNGLSIEYTTAGGNDELAITMTDSGFVDIDRMRRPIAYDFSGIASGHFSETVDGGSTGNYSVTRDGQGRITRITAPDGHQTEVSW